MVNSAKAQCTEIASIYRALDPDLSHCPRGEEKMSTHTSKNERGATAVEYALMVGLIAVAIIGTVTLLGSKRGSAPTLRSLVHKGAVVKTTASLEKRTYEVHFKCNLPYAKKYKAGGAIVKAMNAAQPNDHIMNFGSGAGEAGYIYLVFDTKTKYAESGGAQPEVERLIEATRTANPCYPKG